MMMSQIKPTLKKTNKPGSLNEKGSSKPVSGFNNYNVRKMSNDLRDNHMDTGSIQTTVKKTVKKIKKPLASSTSEFKTTGGVTTKTAKISI